MPLISGKLAQRPCSQLDGIVRWVRVQLLLWIPHVLFWLPAFVRFAFVAIPEVLYNCYLYTLGKLYPTHPHLHEETLYQQYRSCRILSRHVINRLGLRS